MLILILLGWLLKRLTSFFCDHTQAQHKGLYKGIMFGSHHDHYHY